MLAHLQRIVAWLRSGYPQGIPTQDYVPLFALLRRRLSDEEAAQLAGELVEKGLIPPDQVDIATEYLRITDELPSPEELARVTNKLRETGWAIDEGAPRDVGGDT